VNGSDVADTARLLIRVAQRARLSRLQPLVIKLGGSAMEEPAATQGTLECIATLWTWGLPLVLVHGGGKPIDRAMAAAGLTPRKVAGRRYTDDATRDVVVRVLGELNSGIVSQLDQLGVNAIGLTSACSFPLGGERLLLPGLDLQPIDLGHVGRITQVNLQAFEQLGTLPVLPSLALDVAGQWLNVNADTVASAIAGALNAESVLFLTDTPGVLKDVANPASRIPLLTRTECEELIRNGTIAGGMVPKVEACLEALDAGARRAVILDGRDPHALLCEWITETPAGTAITRA
jgi:acetylglutamate kinase